MHTGTEEVGSTHLHLAQASSREELRLPARWREGASSCCQWNRSTSLQSWLQQTRVSSSSGVVASTLKASLSNVWTFCVIKYNIHNDARSSIAVAAFPDCRNTASTPPFEHLMFCISTHDSICAPTLVELSHHETDLSQIRGRSRSCHTSFTIEPLMRPVGGLNSSFSGGTSPHEGETSVHLKTVSKS